MNSYPRDFLAWTVAAAIAVVAVVELASALTATHTSSIARTTTPAPTVERM